MESSKIDQFFLLHGEKFPIECITDIRASLAEADEEKSSLIMAYPYKSPTLAIILSVFFGGLGVDRFYAGNILLGVLKLITGGLCGLWWFIDLFLIMGATRRTNYANLAKIL